MYSCQRILQYCTHSFVKFCSLRIEAQANLAGQMEGLCGDFDEDEKNDFKTPQQIIESDLSVFVNSWRSVGSNEGCVLVFLKSVTPPLSIIMLIRIVFTRQLPFASDAQRSLCKSGSC